MTQETDTTLQATQAELAKTRAELEKVRANAQNGSDETTQKFALETERLRDELRKAQGEAIAAGDELQKLRGEVVHAGDEGQKLRLEVQALKDELRASKRNVEHLTNELQLRDNGIPFPFLPFPSSLPLSMLVKIIFDLWNKFLCCNLQHPRKKQVSSKNFMPKIKQIELKSQSSCKRYPLPCSSSFLPSPLPCPLSPPPSPPSPLLL